MMSDLTCAICDLEPTNEYPTWRQKDGVIRHQNTLVYLGAAIARAEAAEKRVAELEAQLEEATQLLSIAIDRLPEEEQEIVALRWALSGTFTNELPTIAAPAPQEPTP